MGLGLSVQHSRSGSSRGTSRNWDVVAGSNGSGRRSTHRVVDGHRCRDLGRRGRGDVSSEGLLSSPKGKSGERLVGVTLLGVASAGYTLDVGEGSLVLLLLLSNALDIGIGSR